MPRKEAYAVIALTEAVKVGIDSDNKPEAIVATAELFYNFLAAEGDAAPAATPKAEKPAAEKPATTKTTAVKPATEKKEAAKPAENPKLQEVKEAIKGLLQAGLKEQASALLKEHGATSASSLVEKGDEAIAAFLAAAEEAIATS